MELFFFYICTLLAWKFKGVGSAQHSEPRKGTVAPPSFYRTLWKKKSLQIIQEYIPTFMPQNPPTSPGLSDLIDFLYRSLISLVCVRERPLFHNPITVNTEGPRRTGTIMTIYPEAVMEKNHDGCVTRTCARVRIRAERLVFPSVMTQPSKKANHLRIKKKGKKE